jgi:hypothetical protein
VDENKTFNNTFNNTTGHDPVTGEPINDIPEGGPANGPVNFDPMAGASMNEIPVNGPMNFDPMTGEPTPEYLERQRAMQQGQAGASQPGAPFPQGQPGAPIDPSQQAAEDKKANTLCYTSLASWIIGNLIAFWGGAYDSPFGEFISKYISPFSGLFLIAGMVLAIIAKVNYPKSKFAKALLIVYIVEIVLGILLLILAVVSCILIIDACFNDCGNLP